MWASATATVDHALHGMTQTQQSTTPTSSVNSLPCTLSTLGATSTSLANRVGYRTTAAVAELIGGILAVVHALH